MNRTDILGALARGYCTEKNSKKVVDPDLIEAMADEVLKLHNIQLRDWFAGQFLCGLVSYWGGGNVSDAAKLSYNHADAMMKERAG